MTPETTSFFDKAQDSLTIARISLQAGSVNRLMFEVAARAAYYAAFHAAQALISERVEKSIKTHNGVHSEFNRLARHEPIDPSLVAFLSKSYEFKT